MIKENGKLLAQAMSQEEAKREAEARFGDRQHFEGEARREAAATERRMRWRTGVESVLQDLRYGLRLLKKSPGFTLVALLILSLGIGATSTMYAVVDSVLLSPLPFPDSEDLVFVWENRTQNPSRNIWVSLANVQEWRKRNSVFSSLGALQRRPYTLTGRGDPARLNGFHVSADLLPTLGVQPALGRGFSAEDEHLGSEPVCFVSVDFWRNRLGAPPDLTEARVTLDGTSHAVVGVLPSDLSIPGFGSFSVLTPLRPDPSHPNYRGNHNSWVLGRLADGVDLDAANAQMAALAQVLEEEYPEWNRGIGAHVVRARDLVGQAAGPSLFLVLGSVSLVLLLSCGNLAALLLAKGTGRAQEVAIRTALGASRRRLIQMGLTQASVLSLTGGAMGLMLTLASVRALRVWSPAWIPRTGELSVDPSVLAFALCLSLATGMAFGMFPALHGSRAKDQNSLSRGGTHLDSLGSAGVHRSLVAAQTGLGLVLLLGTGLLLRSFVNLTTVEPGFRVENRVALPLSLPAERYGDPAEVAAVLDGIVRQVEAFPGVRRAGVSIGVPVQVSIWRKQLTVEDRPAQELADVPVIDFSIVTPGFLETLEVPLHRGRSISVSDTRDSPLIAVINRTFAQDHFGAEDPIGQRIRFGIPDHLIDAQGVETLPPWYTIVGVVGDVRSRGPGNDPRPGAYIAQTQDQDGAREFFLVAHVESGLQNTADGLRETVWTLDPNLPVPWIRSLDEIWAGSLARSRLTFGVVAVFGAAALLLSLVGVFGLVSNGVARRTREIGLRMALGARPATVVRPFLFETFKVTFVGLALGLLAAGVFGRVLTSVLFGVTPLDPIVFTLAPLSFGAAALVAALLPALRATRISPVRALNDLPGV